MNYWIINGHHTTDQETLDERESPDKQPVLSILVRNPESGDPQVVPELFLVKLIVAVWRMDSLG